jgi:hypothetical protein
MVPGLNMAGGGQGHAWGVVIHWGVKWRGEGSNCGGAGSAAWVLRGDGLQGQQHSGNRGLVGRCCPCFVTASAEYPFRASEQ